MSVIDLTCLTLDQPFNTFEMYFIFLKPVSSILKILKMALVEYFNFANPLAKG